MMTVWRGMRKPRTLACRYWLGSKKWTPALKLSGRVENLRQHDFSIQRPNSVWVTDIAERVNSLKRASTILSKPGFTAITRS